MSTVTYRSYKNDDDDDLVDLLEVVKKHNAPLTIELRKAPVIHQRSEAPIFVNAFELLGDDTKVVASLVPDEIIYNCNDFSHQAFDACLLAGDVSGFTELTETYSKIDGGPSKVTQMLNRYIGAMVQETMSYGGDILKFSGDAFIVVFKKSDFLSMRDAVHEAIDCGLIIQKTHGMYTTDVGVVIRVKLVIAAGTLAFSIIGDENNAHYLEVGAPIWDIKRAENMSSPGDIIVCQSAWKFINTQDYIYKKLDINLHVKVHGIGQYWRPVLRNVGQKAQSRLSTNDENIEDIYLLRPSIDYAATKNLKDKLRKFIITPVMTAIDLKEPLDYLTEVRHVTVVFINVVISKNVLDANIFLNVSNETYKVVCGILKKFNGIMNKMNVFDKDLMMLTIFGFRGNRLGGEAERGLRCAWECYQRIKLINYVDSVSCGVTSGNTYCGVFGHILRKEYTVMGKVVNKAARVMMAYPTIITCDRMTFLLCRMPTIYFTLMEFKSLKGISRPGPIYKFKLIKFFDMLPSKNLQFPLLGRDYEIQTFLALLDKARKTFRTNDNTINILVSVGKPLLGQRRLSEEFIYLTPKTVPIIRINISSNKNKYEPIRKLFYPPMGLSGYTTPHERQTLILNRLEKLENKQLLWCLNPIFEVVFLNEEGIVFTEAQTDQIVKKLLSQLAYTTFVTFWVVLIRKLDFIDENVWNIIFTLSKLKLFFLICEKSDDTIIPKESEENVKTLYLEPIHRIYHAALSCQYLGVRGLSPELDRFIQSKTKGTPGYLENILTTMKQNNEVVIKWTSRVEAYDRGFILPPEFMLIRHLKIAFKSYNEMRWTMYNECYKDSENNGSSNKQSIRIQVAMLNPDIDKLDDSDILNEYTYALNNKMMRIYDACTPYEQLIIKCSSVLMMHFQRFKLLYVMNSKSDLQTALAIKSLFERKVLTCAHGNFLEGEELIFRGRLIAPNEPQDIKCDCRGVILDDFGLHLPKYASCGYLQFRFVEFKTMCYSLLTDNQKKEFHHRAIRYLELETRKCKPCGAGYFAIIVSRHSRDIIRSKVPARTNKQKSNMVNVNQLLLNKFIEDDDTKKTGYSVHSFELLRKKNSMVLDQTTSSNKAELSFDRSERGTRFFIDSVFSKRPSLQVTSSFSDFDFAECKCHTILTSMYCEIIHHSKGIDEPEHLYNTMVLYVYRCVQTNNHPEAVNILFKALELLENPTFKETLLEWQIDQKRGKVCTLLGYAQLSINQVDEAYENFNKALKLYGFPFPKGKYSIKHRIRNEKLKLSYRFYVSPNHKFLANDTDSDFCSDLSECLFFMTKVFMLKDLWMKAELSAYWCLNKALDGEDNYIIHLNAFENIISVNTCTQHSPFIHSLEIKAIQLTKIRRNFDKKELIAVIELLGAVFHRRLIRLKVEGLYEMGEIIWKVGKTTNAVLVLLDNLPRLISICIITKKIPHLIPIMTDLYTYANLDVDNSGLYEYYSLCLLLQIETGFSVESLRRCTDFVLGQSFSHTVRDPNSKNMFYALMWLWYIRKQYWEAAKIWEKEAFGYIIDIKCSFLHSSVTGLYILEGLIIYLVHKMDKRSIEEVKDLRAHIESLIKHLKVHAKYVKVIQIRLKSLQIYYQLVIKNNYKLLGQLKKLQKEAVQTLNALEIDRLQHIEYAWTNKLSQSEANRWIEKCNLDSLLEFSEVEEGKIAIFTLPLPLYL